MLVFGVKISIFDVYYIENGWDRKYVRISNFGNS